MVQKKMKSEYKVGRYSNEEDQIIINGVANGELMKEIAIKLTRNPKSVKDHYDNFLAIPSRDWTEEESQQVIKLYNDGLGWAEIARRLGRSDHQVRNRYRVLSKQHNLPNIVSPIKVYESSNSVPPKFVSTQNVKM